MRFLSLLAVLAVAPSTAHATIVIAPADGAHVGSLPLFHLDTPFAGGSIELEFSRQPELQTAGGSIGSFVDVDDSDIRFFDPPNIQAITPHRPLNSGVWYWHFELTSYDERADSNGQWSPVRQMTVADEPPVLAGWTASARALKRKRHKCRRARFTGAIIMEDNDPQPDAQIVVRVRSHRNTRRFTKDAYLKTGYSFVACAHRRARVTVVVRDRVGQISRVETRTIRVRHRTGR